MVEADKERPNTRLTKLIIKNFRCIGRTPVEIDLDDIVVLVGPNNVGKSSILKAYQVIMSEGSKEGSLSIDDFPNNRIEKDAFPEIELHTIVNDNSPGEEWVQLLPSGEKLVKEKWIWADVGPPDRKGFNTKEKVPWGAAGIANARRPLPHRIDAFASPENQADEITKILDSILDERIKNFNQETDGDTKSDYKKLVQDIAKIRKNIIEESNDEIKKIETQLSQYIGEIFPGYSVHYETHPEQEKGIPPNLFRGETELRMGKSDIYLSKIAFQGSGARRALLWTALRLITETGRQKPKTQTKKTEAKKKTNEVVPERPNVLLLDEPEICLHPNAIRDACRVLYNLPSLGNWQVIITTHSPCFIDVSKDNTSIVRVGLNEKGEVFGTTIFRPKKASLSENDKELLKLLNIFDPYVAEFFFGGKTIVVEGDTEYTAFKCIIAQYPDKYKNIHIIRARGKATIVSLVKILNHFGSSYSILHDSDSPKTIKIGKEITNSAWSINESIVNTVKLSAFPVRLIASVPNFEEAYFDEKMKDEKPYNALIKIKEYPEFFKKVDLLLESLVDHTKPVPSGAIEWNSLGDLKDAYDKSQTKPS